MRSIHRMFGRVNLVGLSLLSRPHFLPKKKLKAVLKEEGEDMDLTQKEVGRLFANVPHTCECCVGCEVEPCEGSGSNSFLLSERRVVDRLCELVKADKEGRCIILPCKVGDTVYRIWEGVDVETEGGVLSCWEVEHIEIYADEILFVDNNDNTFTEKDIDKTVFLTREAAEAALKERENNEAD